MKIIFSLFFILMITNTHASKWIIKKKKDIFILENKTGNFYQVRSSGGMPKYIEQKKLNKKFTIIIYYSGTAGTTTPIEIQRAVLFKGKAMSYVGDFPYKHIGVKEQPKWDIQKDQVTIIDNETGLNKTVE